MKKVGKITLAKTYDVLSESEMKRVVGGSDSGSGSGSGVELVTCSGKKKDECGGYCQVDSTTVGQCFYQELGAETGCYCEHPLVWQ